MSNEELNKNQLKKQKREEKLKEQKENKSDDIEQTKKISTMH